MRKIENRICSVSGCGRKMVAKGLCQTHWQRQHSGRTKSTDPEREIGNKNGVNNSHWKGGNPSRGDGRVLVMVPEHPCANSAGYVLRSRIVMGDKLGRVLTPSEHVHHINGDMSDDRQENLEILSHSKHALLHSQKRTRDKYGRYT